VSRGHFNLDIFQRTSTFAVNARSEMQSYWMNV